MTVLALAKRRTNAALIADCATLGYLTDDMAIWDPTYGLGTFWNDWQPDPVKGGLLFRTDIDPAKSPDFISGVDATRTTMGGDHWGAVVLDPPYKLNGTDQGEGHRYGVTAPATRADKHRLMADMLTEAHRVVRPGGTVLFKCQDQVEGGRVRWQTHTFAAHGETLGLELVDLLLFPSYRPQPSGRSQHHARRNYSSLLVFTKPKRRRAPAIDLGGA